ncbi:MAG: hypothetical protein ABIJ31_14940 [Pseudomonadota bacterium]
MKQYRKIIIFCAMGWCLSLFSGGFYPGQPDGISGFGLAFAADETQDNPDKTSGQNQAEQETQKKGKTGEKNPCPDCPECPDPAKVVLRGLEEKRTMVEKEQKSMLEQKKQLQAFEEQIDEKLESLKNLKKQIEEDMALLEKKKSQKEQEEEAAYEARIGRLVKTYAGMKPKDAAAIVNTLNLEVAQEIFLRMKETSASGILALVESSKAAKISERLAFKRK